MPRRVRKSERILLPPHCIPINYFTVSQYFQHLIVMHDYNIIFIYISIFKYICGRPSCTLHHDDSCKRGRHVKKQEGDQQCSANPGRSVTSNLPYSFSILNWMCVVHLSILNRSQLFPCENVQLSLVRCP